MPRITDLERCIKSNPEQTQAKLDELIQALIELKKVITIPERPEIQKEYCQLAEAVLSAKKIIETLEYRYHKKS